TQILIELQCSNGIILFDEIDKLGATDKGRAVQYALLHITDYTQNYNFRDDFIPEIPIDLSKIWFMFSMNDDTHLDRTLRDRIHVITVSDYNFSDMRIIVTNYLIPKITKCYDSGITLSDEAVNFIIRYSNKGIRHVEYLLQSIFRRINFMIKFKDM